MFKMKILTANTKIMYNKFFTLILISITLSVFKLHAGEKESNIFDNMSLRGYIKAMPDYVSTGIFPNLILITFYTTG